MNSRLASQLHEILRNPRHELASEKALRVTASTLSRARADEISATTFVGTLGPGDPEILRELVQEITDEYELDATITFQVGSFSVRFERFDA